MNDNPPEDRHNQTVENEEDSGPAHIAIGMFEAEEIERPQLLERRLSKILEGIPTQIPQDGGADEEQNVHHKCIP